MYIPPMLVQLMHEDRLREAQKLQGSRWLVYDINEPVPTEHQGGLINRIKQWMQMKHKPQQEVVDARRATAV